MQLLHLVGIKNCQQMSQLGQVQEQGTNTEILVKCRKHVLTKKFFKLPCNQRYDVHQNKNLLFKTYKEKESRQQF